MKEAFAKLLEDTAKNIRVGNCEIAEEQAIEITSLISHKPMTREEVCNYLNVSKTRFYELVDDGIIPRGKKRIGSKEKWWYKDEIEKCENKR